MPSAEIVFERTIAEALRRAKLLVAGSSFATEGDMADGFDDAAVAVRAAFDELHAADFGVVGDGVADDTIPMQAALDAGALQDRVVSGANLIVKITGPLHMSGPGLVFNMTSFGVVGDPGIYVTGAGYTGLTVTGQPSRMRISIYAADRSTLLNGIFFDNANFMQAQKLRAVNFNGFGLKFERLWDSSILDCSVELCGNATEYAFQVRSGSDTSNMSHFGRIQVERSVDHAILIDSTTLSCVFDNIHTERGTASGAVVMWDIGAARSQFSAARFNSDNPTLSTLKYHGENTTFIAQAVEGAIPIVFDAVSVSTMTFIAPNFNESTLSLDIVAHTGFIQIVGGMVYALATAAEDGRIMSAEFLGTKFQFITIGACGNPARPSQFRFQGCRIGTLASSDTLSSARFVDCVIAESGNLLEYRTELIRCDVTKSSAMAMRGCVIADATTFNCNVSVNDGSSLVGGNGSKINGTLTFTTSNASLLDSTWSITGTVTGCVSPNGTPAAQWDAAQRYYKGQRMHNYAAGAAQPPGWQCVTTGVGGVYVFKAEAALAP